MYAVMDTHYFGKACIDLTGCFPHRASKKNEYILVGYHHNDNAILSTALKRSTAVEIIKGWKILNKKLLLNVCNCLCILLTTKNIFE